jgi:hypothetical protein
VPLLPCRAGANGDIAVISGVLQTANSIFKRYRDQYRSNALVNELQKTQVRSSSGQPGTAWANHAECSPAKAHSAVNKQPRSAS